MANTLWEKIEAKLGELTAKLTASTAAPTADHSKTISDFRSQLDAFKLDLDAKEGEIAKLKASAVTNAEAITAKDLEITTLKASQTEFDAKVATAASAKAGAIVAEIGHPPLNGTKAETPGAETKPVLFGIAKVQAAIKAQIAQAPQQ